jgi:hypothetical protein
VCLWLILYASPIGKFLSAKKSLTSFTSFVHEKSIAAVKTTAMLFTLLTTDFVIQQIYQL